MDPTLSIILAFGLGIGLGVMGWILGRPARPQPQALQALQETVETLSAALGTMRGEVTAARAEAASAHQEASDARVALGQATKAWAGERRDLWRQLDDLRTDLTKATSYSDQLIRAIGQEPDGGARVLARVPAARTPTAPLSWRALFPPAAQAALLTLLLGALDRFGTREGRGLLLSGCPDSWVEGVRRADTPREDLTAIIEGAARYDPALLGAVLGNALEVVGAGSQTGGLLQAWRSEWRL